MREEGCVKGKIGIYHFLPAATSIRKAERILPHLLWAQPKHRGGPVQVFPHHPEKGKDQQSWWGKLHEGKDAWFYLVWLNSDLSVSNRSYDNQTSNL